jgi:ATP-dependent DNA ligase
MRPYTGRARPVIRDPVVEPFWTGLRVLAHVGPGATADAGPVARLLADDGSDLGPELPDIAAQVTAAVRALDAVVDGIVTSQVGLQGVGAAPITEVRASATAVIMRGTADIDIVPRGRDSTGAPDEEGFVAVDLLSVDGSDLLDVPLLERKRLLESVVAETQHVRLSVLARPPIDPWIATWKALGLRGGMLKAANSRYEPGERSAEWRVVERVGRVGA